MKRDPRAQASASWAKSWCDVYFRPLADSNAKGGFKLLMVQHRLSVPELREARWRQIAYHAIHTPESKENLSSIRFDRSAVLMLIEVPAVPGLETDDA